MATNNQEVLFKVRIDGEDKTFKSLEELNKEVDKLQKDSDIELTLDSGEVVKGVDNVKKSMKGLQKGVDSGGKSFKMFDNILKGSGIFALGTILIEIVQELGILDGLFKALRPALQPLANVIQDVFGELGALLGPIIKQLVDALMPAFKLLTPVLKVVAPIFELIGIAIETISDAISGAVNFIGDLTDKMGTFGKVVGAVLNPIGAISDALDGAFGGSGQSDVAKYNEQVRNLEKNMAAAEAEAEKYRGTADRLLSLAENSATAEEDRLNFIIRAEQAAQKEAAARVKAAQMKVDAIREEIRLYGESQENTQALAEAEQELATQRADAAQREEEFSRVRIENAQTIAESENLTFQEKEKQIKASFELVKQKRRQNVEAAKQLVEEVNITEELIERYKLEGKLVGEQLVYANQKLEEARERANKKLKLANDELKLAEKQEKKILQTASDTNDEYRERNKLLSLGADKELLEAQIQLNEAMSDGASIQERLKLMRENQKLQEQLIEITYQEEIEAAGDDKKLIQAAQKRKHAALLDNEKTFNDDFKKLLDERTDEQIKLIDRVTKKLEEQAAKTKEAFKLDFVDPKDAEENAELLNKQVDQMTRSVETPKCSLMDKILGLCDEEGNPIDINDDERFAMIANMAGNGLQQALSITNDIFAIQAQNLQNELDSISDRIEQRGNRLNELRNAALKATGDQKDAAIAAYEAERKEIGKLEKERTEAERKIAEVKRKQAIADKAAAISEIAIQTAIGIVSAQKLLAPAGQIVAGIIGAIGATQAGIVAAQPIPQFKKGGFTGSASSDDIEMGVVHSNEYVVPANIVRNPKFSKNIQQLESARLRGYQTGGMVGGDTNTTVNNIENITEAAQQPPRIVVDVQEVIDISDKVNRVRSRASL